MRECADRFKYVKFLKIVSTEAVPNFPNQHLPALFIYKDGQLIKQMIGIDKIGGVAMTADGMTCARASRFRPSPSGSLQISSFASRS